MTHAAYPSAELDRRLTAYVVDRLVVWGASAGIGYAGWQLAVAPGRVWLAVVVGVAAAMAFGLAAAVLLGTTGLSPGKAVCGLRVVRRSDGSPIGVLAAIGRTAVLGVAGLPTLGLGVATLAWTAAMDPEGQRRGLHDRIGDAVVVDVRHRPVVDEPAAEVPTPQIVNLTAMRLMPAPTPAPAPEPASGPSPSGPVPPPDAAPPTAPPPPPAATPSIPPPAEPPARPPETPLHASTVRRGGPATGQPPESRWRVEFDTGEAFVVAGLVLVGRRPEPREGEEMWRAVALRSDDMSISKTHAQFQVTPEGTLVLMDRGSTNGTFVIRQGLSKALSPGRPSTLLHGDKVRIGDRTMAVSKDE